ncbi:hypothetical protein SAMN05444161_4313 [Rhizobiales bacterium GAS191]|jgi:hypothetical protein|nr:hypothetical protein SAMN05519103_03606 [Rhizobiales bacterium GAS113]SED89356.1 hypothetical protein SAMN05444161_4313 [Rhizobiales bacterium GAS191]SEE56957.1 hypothetical protein SAMN05519104_6560 [Rhizobiales bacterium GAS188]
MKRSSAFILGLGFVAAAPAAASMVDSLVASRNAASWSLGWVSSAQAAEDVSFDNLSFAIGDASIKIPHIAINGSSLSKGDVQNLVSGPWSLSSADTLAKFDATSIVIPEVDLTMTSPMPGKDGPMTQVVTYHDFHIDGIKGGKAARISSAGMTADVKGPMPMSYTVGTFLATDYDLAGAVRMFYAAAQPGEAPKQLVGPSSIESMKFKGPQGVEVNIGHLSAGAMKMRPLSTPLASLMQTAMQAGAANPGKPLPPAETAKMVGMLAEFYDAFAVDGMSASDISIKVPDPSFQGASLKTFKIGAIANSRFAEFGIEGLEVNAAGGHVKLGRAALLGMDLKPFLSALAAVAKTGDVSDAAMSNLDWRTAIPHLDGIVLKSVDVSVPQGPSPKSVTLAGYELKLGNYVGAIPTSIRTQLDDLSADVGLMQDQAAQLQQLGYKSVDVSNIVDLIWHENSKSISVNELSAKGANMGAVSLKGTFGNVPRELFAGNIAQMQVAGLGVTLGDATLRLENTGLLDKIVALMAKGQNTTPDNLRAQWGTQAALGIPQLLGGSDKAKSLANAVASFIAKPKSLTISVKAKDATGLGLTDVVGGGGPDPAAIFNKLDVTATANQ